ncbi:ArsR family transcriptional regulator [Herbihabitans rhizosphaerae]|uniref:ArsR family transcriptional regulator n=1 Tax=Herbihabitans rhizosphaerae TaxID=1872711 RepID=A0A4Q7KS33_9PSEU|nr:metalloregulator ArsR/SmtB family transcription factor [Herbihabitans rhizosphaerae]RZS38900.1 ArsR family transcriptional regulator [Herbihabitans rhizosphaerae]
MVNDVWAALADPTRRRVVELLGSGPSRPSELADRIGTSRPALSRHLKVLRGTGIVTVDLDDTDARGLTYRLAPDGLTALRAWLDQVQAHWTDQLAEFKRHAERS